MVAKVLEYQHGQMPMFFETLWVNVKLKFSVPSAGREMPSIFCSTQGPTLTLVVVPAVTDCHGQPNATCGSRTLSPTRCRAPDSTASTAQTMILRKIRATRTRTAPQASFRGSHLRRAGLTSCPRITCRGAARPGATWRGTVWRGTVWRGAVWCGPARRDLVRCGSGSYRGGAGGRYHVSPSHGSSSSHPAGSHSSCSHAARSSASRSRWSRSWSRSRSRSRSRSGSRAGPAVPPGRRVVSMLTKKISKRSMVDLLSGRGS